MTGLILATIFSACGMVGDTIISPARIISAKQPGISSDLPFAVTELRLKELESRSIGDNRALADMVPGLYIPDYGSSMTSTIYMRGLGSRMENPVLSLYVDDIPVLDKNAYDADYIGLRSAKVLRGPQGTLYGRNSMCGVLALTTLSPGDVAGWSGILEGGTATRLRAALSCYGSKHAFNAFWRSGNGYFTNTYDGSKCDPYRGAGLRWKYAGKLSDRISLSNILSFSALSEGAFPYGQWTEGRVCPVNYNDEGSYRRLSILEGVKLRKEGDKAETNLIASIQCLADDMRMDQDFTAEPVFTLRQRQRNAAGTLELILRPSERKGHWNRTTGAFAYYRYNDMYAPVQFREGGIRSLMEDNANAHIPEFIGKLDITDRALDIPSRFAISSWNTAIYHESLLEWGRWSLTLGMRLDYEGAYMDYSSNCTLHYTLGSSMAQAREVSTDYTGSKLYNRLELLPKIAAMYKARTGKGLCSIFGGISKGYRSGGFNTQIFSDILQQRITAALMADMGVHFPEASSVSANDTRYEPEDAWNMELGMRFSGGSLQFGATAYLLECINQQLTVFPPGKSTGRMMTNAGRSRSYGIEAEGSWRRDRFGADASWGWNRSYFREYRSGDADYSGKRIPYTPEHTLYLCAHYRLPLQGKHLKAAVLLADLRAAGPVFWDETGTLRENAYFSTGGRFSLEFNGFQIYLRGENLNGSGHNTFYFKSVGREFFQKAKPARLALGMKFNL